MVVLVVVVVVVVVVLVVSEVVFVVLLVVVVGVVGIVLQARPQDPLALRRNLRVGHHLQPLGLQGLMNNGGGSGAGFDGDFGRGVPHPRVGLDGGALGDGDIDEGLDRVVLRGCLHGSGSCWG